MAQTPVQNGSAAANDVKTMRRPGCLGVHSVDHFVLAVPDLDEAQRFYELFGLEVRKADDRLELRACGHPHRWAIIEKGERKKLSKISFACFEDDYPRFREHLQREGVAFQEEGQRLCFTDYAGLPLEIQVAERSAPTEPSSFSGECPSFARSKAPSVFPRRLAHIAVFTPSVDEGIEFYSRVLGLRLSDRSLDAVAFMHGPHGSEHHLIALLASDGPGLHHTSWDVASIQEVGLGAGKMAENGFAYGWGLGRHVLGSNYFHYIRDPWGSYVEYTAGMDYIPVDAEWEASNSPPEDSMYLWGPALPEDFITNFETRA